MIVWSRHVHAPAGAPFCAVVQVGASVVTACRGRWEPHERDEIRWSISATEQCGGCARALEKHGADLEALRQLHRDLVALRQAGEKRDPDDASDPTWVRGAEEARERMERRGR